MIYISLLIHKLGHYLPLWITREKFKDLRVQFKWKQIIIEMSGVLANFLFAFLIILITTLVTKERYLENKNAIYGIQCSSLAKEIGFKDGDKIISINDKLTISRKYAHKIPKSRFDGIYS